MAQLASSDLFLVGSVPVASDKPEDVMRLCGRTLGDRLFALPDGEVGERRMWIGGLGATTFSKHPDLEKAPEAGPFGAYRFKPGVTSISFKGYLPYADAAISSYYRFRDLRDAGELPAGLHFQVALPTPHAAIGGYFVQDWEMLHAAYHDAIVDDISRMLEEIPAEDLVIQWDYCTELCDTVGVDTDNREIDALWPWNPKGTTEQKFATHTAKEYIAPLTEGIPAEVLYGYHLCLGTWPKCPLTPVRDLTSRGPDGQRHRRQYPAPRGFRAPADDKGGRPAVLRTPHRPGHRGSAGVPRPRMEGRTGRDAAAG